MFVTIGDEASQQIPAAGERYKVDREGAPTVLKFDNMTEEKQNELAEIAASHGMSTAHLVEIAQGQPRFGRDEVAGTTQRRDVEPDHKIGRAFHFGESRFLSRRP